MAIIWHQHQPLYVDVAADRLNAPWVRTHTTKDYYDMASIVGAYPNVHCTINLTTSLLKQIQTYYVDRLGAVVTARTGKVNLRTYMQGVRGKIDPWIDLLLKPTEEFGTDDRQFLYGGAWSALSINKVLVQRFPEYEQLKERFSSEPSGRFSTAEMRELKLWFFLAHFDPDFLDRAVQLPSGDVCDLSDLVAKKADGKYYLRRRVTEADCQRIAVEVYKVASNVVPIHRKLQYHPVTGEGQIELVTTPFAHPILPLLYDSDVAHICQPHHPLPPRFHFPKDVDAQIKKAVAYYEKLFGTRPVGMWPAEGAVSQDVIPYYAKNGIRWIATDKQILERSVPSGQSHLSPYRLQSDATDVVILFRDTVLSDKVGFRYQQLDANAASDDFIQHILQFSPREGEPDKLLTVILDGENAWEWYRHDHDGKKFLHTLYRKLEELYAARKVITVTPSEFLLGNRTRNVPAHPPSTLPAIERLWPGSWINASFDTWIGEEQKNTAWRYLQRARTDLERAGVPHPETEGKKPRRNSRQWYTHQAWESLYAAEGSDWFWWYGGHHDAPFGKKPFDTAFRTHLQNIYFFSAKAGAKISAPSFPSIIGEEPPEARARRGESQSAMAPGSEDLARVVFRCRVPEGMNKVFIVGNQKELAEWVPNKIPMRLESGGDEASGGERIWMWETILPRGAEVQYKYTSGGTPGQWDPGDESAGRHRTLVVGDSEEIVIDDVFGRLDSSA